MHRSFMREARNREGGGDNTVVCAWPPCGMSPMKDKRACKLLRIDISKLAICISTLK